MALISAQEALELMPSNRYNVDKALTVISEIVKEAAMKNKIYIRLGYHTAKFDPCARDAISKHIRWIGHAGDTRTEDEKKFISSLVSALKSAGYTVKEYYEERQFVDTDLIVSWA